MSTTFRVDTADLARTLATLSNLPHKIRQKAIRIGMNKAGALLKGQFESRAPVDMGFLRRSGAVKVVQKKATKDWHVTVGANRKKVYKTAGKSKHVATVISTRKRIYSNLRKPSRYLHLANNGTTKGRRGHHFIESVTATAGPIAVAVASARIREEVIRLSAIRS